MAQLFNSHKWKLGARSWGLSPPELTAFSQNENRKNFGGVCLTSFNNPLHGRSDLAHWLTTSTPGAHSPQWLQIVSVVSLYPTSSLTPLSSLWYGNNKRSHIMESYSVKGSAYHNFSGDAVSSVFIDLDGRKVATFYSGFTQWWLMFIFLVLSYFWIFSFLSCKRLHFGHCMFTHPSVFH